MILENLHLTVEALAGSDISETCREAVSLANHLRLTVDFKFNGVTVMAKPGVDPKALTEAWREALNSKYDHKFACVHK